VTRHEELNSMFDALERGDLEFVRSWFEQRTHPEIEFTSALTSEIEGRVYRGHNGMVEWARGVMDAVEITYGEREFSDLGDDVVVVLARPRVAGRGSGVEMPIEVGFVVEFEGDLARRGASYFGHAAALEAGREAAANA
jgi:ketosteroid isomerase-like protein